MEFDFFCFPGQIGDLPISTGLIIILKCRDTPSREVTQTQKYQVFLLDGWVYGDGGGGQGGE